MDIVNAHEEIGSLRAAALYGTTHKTLKRVLQRRTTGQWSVDEVGEGLFDDGVPAVGEVGVHGDLSVSVRKTWCRQSGNSSSWPGGRGCVP